jgi:two-component system nitrate/nitrite response regulator NarP
MTAILIADDHPIIVSGLRAILAGTDYDVVGAVSRGDEVAEAVARLSPDILLLDISMPGRTGIEVLRDLRAAGDPRAVILLTAGLEDADLLDAVALGVEGIVLKEGAHNLLIPCLDAVREGKKCIAPDLLHRALDLSLSGPALDPLATLSGRERSIAELVARGLRNRDIAETLEMNEGTVKVYLHRVYRKLGIASRTELALLAREPGKQQSGSPGSGQS